MARRCGPLLVVVVVAAAAGCCSGQWVERPENVTARLGASATFNCSAGADAGDVVWMKLDWTGAATLLFFNTELWGADATRTSAAAMPGGGVSITLTSLERADDARYQCSIKDVALSDTAQLTVLGTSLCLY